MMNVAHNLAALTTYGSVKKAGGALEKSIKKLSTGLRINSASDDAAGLAISEKMRAQTRGLSQAILNSQDGISLVQTAEGALSETHSILQRMRELSVQAANDTLTQGDRAAIQLEMGELREEINHISNSTQFNKKKLLNGDAAALWSSDKPETKAVIKGGLRTIDQFGQKTSAEGNYNIDITAEPGQAQVQKSSILKIKHRDVAMGAELNEKAGAVKVQVHDVPAGDYELTTEEPTEARAVATGAYGMRLDELVGSLKVHVSQSNLHNNASILFEVTNAPGKDSADRFITVRATANILKTDGTTENYTADNITLTEEAYTDLSKLLGLGDARTSGDSLDGAMEMKLDTGKAKEFSVGDKFVYNLTVAKDVEGADRTVKITNEQNAKSPDSWQEVVEVQSSNTFERTVMPPVSAKVLFIIDNSSSMTNAINTVKARVKAFANEIYAQGVTDVKMGIATYEYVVSSSHHLQPKDLGGNRWVSTLADIESLANSVSIGGARQNPYTAITEALDSTNPDTYYDMSGVPPEGRHFVLITDTYNEGSTLSGASTLADAKAALSANKITLSAVRNDVASKLPSVNRDILPLITSEGIDMTLSSDWGTTLTDELGKKIGEDTVKAILFETTPLGDFTQFTETGLDGRQLFAGPTDTTTYTLNIEQDGVKHSITIGAQDTLKDISDKLQTALGGGSTVSITPTISENDDGKKVISLTTTLDAGQGRVTFSGDEKLIATLGLRSSLDQKYSLDASAITDKDIHFRNFYLNSTTGAVHEGDVILSTNSNEMGLYETLTTFEAAYVGQISRETTHLRDLESFWDSSGNCILNDPQTITINQGDGRSTSITLYANDTVENARAKLNDAIANGLGQARHSNGDVNQFVSFVDLDQTQDNGSETVGGTLVVRSVIPGAAGTLSFSGSDEILNALGLNTIQEATENQFTVNVTDAHTGKTVMSGVNVTGNLLIDIPTDNVDTEIDVMAGLTAEWDDIHKRFNYTTKDYSTTLHLSDNTTVFQVGANEGEDMAIHIGNMGARALGLDEVNVTTRERAARSITIIDNAIDRVSTQRARLGAYQNRLEHTISNLTTEDENLTAAESRIRDADMAREMMDFSKLQIILQAGNSMLAQANQLPQNVLSLVK